MTQYGPMSASAEILARSLKMTLGWMLNDGSCGAISRSRLG
jgi:hypothetical protein